MSVNNTQAPQGGSILQSVGSSALQLGTTVGGTAAVGTIVSKAIPPSKTAIQKELVDHFVKEQLKSAPDTEITKNMTDSFLKKAEDSVKAFFDTPKKERAADDIVAFAKKAAKDTSTKKTVGFAVLLGLASFVASAFAPKGGTQTSSASQTVSSTQG